MLVSTCLSSSPSMIYFGQEVGEPGAEFGGFGTPSRTSIFDYVGVPHHQRWMNHGAFDGGQLSEDEKALRTFYQKLLNLTLKSPALLGDYHDLYAANFDNFGEMQDQLFAFARASEEQKLIVVANFSAQQGKQVELILPYSLITDWQLLPGQYRWIDRMSDSEYTLNVTQTSASISMLLPPLASLFLELVAPDSEQKL